MFTLYILTTLFLSFYDPMKYYNYDKFLVFIYIIGFLLSLYIGYAIANKYKIVINKKCVYSDEMVNAISVNKKKIIKFVKNSITIAFLSIELEFL